VCLRSWSCRRPATAGDADVWGRGLRAGVESEQVAGLKRLSRENQATLYMTLVAAFAVLLSRYSGQDDIGCWARRLRTGKKLS